MKKNNKPSNKQFAVIGLGQFGRSIATTLIDNGCEVLCCDKNMTLVKEFDAYATDVMQLDVTNDNAMQSVGFENYDCVIIAISDNLEATIMAAMHAIEAGVPMVIAKAKNNHQKMVLEKIGVHKVVMPEIDTGTKLAINLIHTNILDYLTFSDKFVIAQITSRREWWDKNLIENNFRAKYGISIIAIKRGNDYMVSPSPQTLIKRDDILTVIGENNQIKELD